MPLRKPLLSSEVEICRRMRSVREALRFSRPAFGRLLGLDSSKLSNIEHFRVPLDYITGNAVCRICGVVPRWLSTGEGNPRQVFPARVYAPIPSATGRTLFSQAAPTLQERCTEAEQQLSEKQKEVNQVFIKKAKSQPDLNRAWQEAVHEVGASDRAEIDSRLAAEVFGRSPFGLEFENELAIVSCFDDKSGMHHVTAPSDLIDQVQSLTQQRGAKSQLARFLGVSRQRLNEWLSGRSKPSARYLLLLLNWMRVRKSAAAPAEKKSAGRSKRKSPK